MLRRVLPSGIALTVIALAACTSDSEPTDTESGSERFEVTLLAGGGDQEVSEVRAGRGDVRLDGALTSVAAGADGAVWAVSDGVSLLRVDGEGQVSQWTPRLPDGVVEIADIAPAPGGEVYILPRRAPGDLAGEASVYVFTDDGGIEPAFGVPASGDPAADAMPATADGEPAEDARLGRIGDIAVVDNGSIVFVEEIAGAGYEVANLVRRVEDGTLHTVAGLPADAERSDITEGEVHGASFPEVDVAATSVLGQVLIAAGRQGDIVLQTTRSLIEVDEDGALTVRAGSEAGTVTLPRISEHGPLTDPVLSTEAEYRSNLRHAVGPALAVDGGILATTFGGLPDDEDVHQRYLWDVEDGSDRAQEIADAAAEGEDQDLASVYVSDEGQAVTASVFGTGTTMLDDGTIVVAAQDPESGESIMVSFPAAVMDEGEG
ncbi:hypothetical protein [Phytoactinopolyspora halotolerans]|uniref:Uncharacterized protein n=1 Tax=Phytoactinopolyspora halotolerans TaxID=1981512 RepID=A0A6L9SE25_9ACTN|nr:hypothetical protein [Phytoactinopolyspora halotolerans]NEE02788.1 hypothetical protein [Phytoactinopolyspora halotolerans]